MKHLAPISGVACHRDSYVATAGYDNQIILWDGLSRRPIQRAYHDHLANQCTFSPDGRLLASASSDYTARLYEIPTMRLRAVFDGHTDDIEMVAFSPDGTRVATCSRDATLRLFDLSGRLLACMKGHGADVISVSFMPDGQEIISSSDDGTVRRWSVSTGEETACLSFEDVETDALAITPEGLVIAGNDDGEITVIDGEAASSVQAHDAGIKRLVYDVPSARLVSLSYDRKLCLWQIDRSGLQLKASATLPDIVWPRSCAFFDDTRLVFATFGSSFAIYDVVADAWDVEGIAPSISINAVMRLDRAVWTIGDAGDLRRNGEVAGETGSLCNFLAELDGRILAGGQMGRIFDARSGAVLHQHRSPLNCAARFVRDGVPHVAVGAYTGELIVLRVDAGRVVHVATVPVHRNAIKGVASDGASLFTVCADRSAAYVRIADLAVTAMHEAGHDKIANGCATVQEDVFVSVSRDLHLYVWTKEGARKIRSPHVNSIKCVAVSGSLVATCSYAGTLAIYDLKAEQWIEVRRITAAGLSSVVAGEAPETFLVASYDGQVYPVGVERRSRAHAA